MAAGRDHRPGHQGQGVHMRRDHVAGGLFVVAGALILAVSGDLPFGTLASPGAGMLPTLVIVLMMGCGLVLFLKAGDSPPFAGIAWGDLPHAARVMLVASAGVASYTVLGFLITVTLLLFCLTFVIERRPFLPAAMFSLGVTAFAYLAFDILLKLPLPRGILGY
jgi:putative tricarboxylic transport membrane protein